MIKGAYTNKAFNLAEEVVSKQLAEKYKKSLKEDQKKKGRGRRVRKAIQNQAIDLVTKRPKWWINLNKGLLVEFVIFLVSQGFNFFTNCWVLVQVFRVLNEFRFYQQIANVTSLNFTTPGICQGIAWNMDDINEKFTHFEAVTIVYCFFMGITSLLILTQTLSWLYTLWLSMEKKEIGEKGRAMLIRMKLIFLVGMSFLEDIPLSTITAEIFAVQQGSTGITCWLCKVSGRCVDTKALETSLNKSQQVLILNVVAISVTSLWKGISSFYRWSRIPNFEMFFIRACTSLFVGFLFIIVILTPAMTVLTYRYYALPGVTGGLVMDLIDRIYVIGVIFWVIVLAVVFCCPLLNLIRVGNK